MLRFARWLPFVLAVSLWSTSGCDRGACNTGALARPDVVLITVDTLRADHLGSYGFEGARTPHMDALADHGVRVAHAVAPTPLTLPSHATILTGLDPPAHGVRDNASFQLPDEAVTLAERLKAEGYLTQAFVSAMVLNRMFNLDQGFDEYNDQLWGRDQTASALMRERSGQRTMDLVLRWLDAKPHDEKPFFLWVHLFDPHAPYEPPEAYAKKAPSPYDGEIAAVDRQIGRLVEALRTKDVLDDTLLVLTSDHGESLGEHGESTHSLFIYEATVHVPLIFHYPRLLPARTFYEGPVRSADIMPTVLGLLGIQRSPSSGRDLSGAFSGSELPPALTQYSESLHPELEYGMAPLYGIRLDQWTYIRAPRPELYDRSADPDETNNLLQTGETSGLRQSEADAQAAKLDRQLSTSLAEINRLALTPTVKAVDPQTVAMLEALGYVADAEAKRGVQGMDPKDGVRIYKGVQQMRRLLRQRDYVGCVKQGEALLVVAPDNVSALNTLAACWVKRGNPDAAEPYYVRSLRLDPRQHVVLVQLGRLQFAANQLDAARATLQRALAVVPGSVEAMSLMGYLSMAAGNPQDASLWFQKAIAQDRTYAQSYIGRGDLHVAQNRYQEAKQWYDKALDLEPQSFRALFQGAICALQTGDAQTADRYLVRAIEIDPNSLLRNQNLAVLRNDSRLSGFQIALAEATRGSVAH